MTLPLHTDRLIIRRFSIGDIDNILDFTTHPSVSREIANMPHHDRSKMPTYIESQNRLSLFEARTCVDLAVELKETGRVIGLLSLVSDGHRQGEIGWGFGIDYRGRGLATEAARRLMTYAFHDCGYHRLFAGTIITNERSWRLMERLGMRKEAHFVQAHVPETPGGTWVDTVRYAILADEWVV